MSKQRQVEQIKTFIIDLDDIALSDLQVNKYCAEAFGKHGNYPRIVPTQTHIHVIHNALVEVPDIDKSK